MSNGDLLAVLLTAEGLLFATLAVGVTLQTLGPGNYLPVFVKKGGLALSIAVLTTFVAIGAGAVWAQLYCDDFSQRGCLTVTAAIALAIAIVGQPIIAFAIWLGMRRP